MRCLWIAVACVIVLGGVVSLRAAELARPPEAATPTEDGNWTMPAKNYASTRFSGLDEITRSNVGGGLQVAWTLSTGVLRGHEAAPLVVDGTMYVVTPYPNIVYALDLTKPGAPTMEGWLKAVDARSGEVLWQFKTGSGIIGQPISYRHPDGRATRGRSFRRRRSATACVAASSPT